MYVARGSAVAGPLAGVDQQHLEAARFKHLEQRDPVHARGFQRHGGDSAGPEPVGQRVQVGGVGTEAADRLGGITGRDRGPVLFGTHINAGRVEMHGGQLGGKASDTDDVFRLRGAMAASKIRW